MTALAVKWMFVIVVLAVIFMSIASMDEPPAGPRGGARI